MVKILSICGSPRKGNSETIVNKLKTYFDKMGLENEIILLREKNIEHCNGCVEFCNKNLTCHKRDDMPEIVEKIKSADAYVFVLPNYFNMPTGLFKNFIDRCSIFYEHYDFSKKKAIVICVGADIPKHTDVCLKNVTKNFCGILGIPVVAAKSFQSRSELKGNYNDIFDNKFDPNIENKLKLMAKKLKKSIGE